MFTILVSIKKSNFHEECGVLCVVFVASLLSDDDWDWKCQMFEAQQTAQTLYC